MRRPGGPPARLPPSARVVHVGLGMVGSSAHRLATDRTGAVVLEHQHPPGVTGFASRSRVNNGGSAAQLRDCSLWAGPPGCTVAS